MNKMYKWFRSFDEVLKYIKTDPSFQLKIIYTNETSYKVISTTET
jgi:hypothetical protein